MECFAGIGKETSVYSNSIYDLITKLCRIFAEKARISSPKEIKRLRSMCYDSLLLQENERKEFLSEPDFELLAWQAEIIYDYKMPELANKIRDCAERLKDTFEHNQKLCYDILTFLLRLKSVPLDDEVEEVPKISLFVHPSQSIIGLHNGQQTSTGLSISRFKMHDTFRIEGSTVNCRCQSEVSVSPHCKSTKTKFSSTEYLKFGRDQALEKENSQSEVPAFFVHPTQSVIGKKFKTGEYDKNKFVLHESIRINDEEYSVKHLSRKSCSCISKKTDNKEHPNFLVHHTQSVLFRNPNDCGPTPFDKNRFLLHDSLRIAEKNIPAFPGTFVLPGVQDNKIIEEKPDKNNNSADPPPDCKEEDNFVVKDIWEAALTLKIPQRKTWECFGLQVANTEKPFITELLLEKSQLWISCYHAYENQINVMDKSLLSDLSIIPYQTFIKHLKYLLIGISSKTFPMSEEGVFGLKPGTTVLGYCTRTFREFCTQLILLGSQYNHLNEFSNMHTDSGRDSYIFRELKYGVRRYLTFYKVAVVNFPENWRLERISNHLKPLCHQVDVLVEICFKRNPNSIALLNRLHSKVIKENNKNTFFVLCSIFRACCQSYFNFYLQRWIFHGVLYDPFDEFFIKACPGLISPRARKYWTSSFRIEEDLLPNFLAAHKNEILKCGKAMNLLKLCSPKAKLCTFPRAKSLIEVCFTFKQLRSLEQDVMNYILAITHECGALYCLGDKIRLAKEENRVLLALIDRQRTETLKRLELEKLKKLEEENERKAEEMRLLKEQYDAAILQKRHEAIKDLEQEIEMAKKDLECQELRNKIIREEAQALIDYYTNLNELLDLRKAKVLEHMKIQLNIPKSNEQTPDVQESIADTISIASTDSFRTAIEEFSPRVEKKAEETHLHSLDSINANVKEAEETSKVNVVNENFLMAQENFKAALRNKAKVMSLELGLEISTIPKKKTKFSLSESNLTEAQRNKLKVMSSEFGLAIDTVSFVKTQTQVDINKKKMMESSDCFFYDNESKKLDNDNYVNSNVDEEKGAHGDGQADDLSLQQTDTAVETQSSETNLNSETPMSVDSTPTLPTQDFFTASESMERLLTPNSAESLTSLQTPSESSLGRVQFSCRGGHIKWFAVLHGEPEFTDDNKEDMGYSRLIAPQHVNGVEVGFLDNYLKQSVTPILEVQTRLVNAELLRYFIEDREYLRHLKNLRSYVFLQDGNFTRNITEGLFEKLYESVFPKDLINARTLRLLLERALDCSSECAELSFKSHSLPERFNFRDVNILDCISLTYKVDWPLNILLPSDTIAKYGVMFKYFVKLHRVSWVQKKTFQDLKALTKRVGRNAAYLVVSPQFRKVHHCRHVMTHFIEAFKGYMAGTVMQSSWNDFEQALTNATDLDQLYESHTTYIKNILFMCLLNSKSEPVRKCADNIFTIMLKFYDYLRSRSWTVENGEYVHPNFGKLEEIFNNFKETVSYLFKMGRKIVKTGYQPHLIHLLDMLDISGYYENSVNF